MLENSESVYTYVNNFLLEQAFFCTAVLLPELATAVIDQKGFLKVVTSAFSLYGQ